MKNLKHTFIMVAVTVFFLVVLELLARWIYPVQKPVAREDIAYEHDPVYQIRLKPYMTRQFIRQPENGGDTIRWRTNSMGFRGAELRTSDYRIVIYGDSNVQARFSKEENTYAQQLARLLAAAWQKDVEVLNSGVLGFGPDQALLKFEQEADLLEPDLAILVLFADNDYGDLLRNRLFELDAEGDLKASEIPFEIDGALMSEEDESSLRLLAITRWLNARFFPKAKKEYACYDEWLKQEMLESMTTWEEGSWKQYQIRGPKKYRFRADYYDVDLANYPDLTSSKLKLALMSGVLRRFKESAEAKGIDFLVMILPSAIDMTESNYFISKADIRKPDGVYNPANLSVFAEGICTEEQIEFINLYHPFSKNDPGSLYFSCLDNHWNDAGQELAARETTHFLVERVAVGN